MSESTSEDGFNRRSVLKSVAAGTAATAGATGIASASNATGSVSLSRKRAITADYRDIDTVRSLFETHSDLLDAAAEAGHIEESTFDIFDVKVDGLTSERGDGLGFNAREVEGEVVPEVRVLHRAEEGEVMFAIRPTEDAGYVNFFPYGEDNTHERVYEKNWVASSSDCCGGCGLCGGNCDSNQSCETLTQGCCCWATCYNMTCADYNCVCESNCGWL